jgi:hypothetical protein
MWRVTAYIIPCRLLHRWVNDIHTSGSQTWISTTQTRKSVSLSHPNCTNTYSVPNCVAEVLQSGFNFHTVHFILCLNNQQIHWFFLAVYYFILQLLHVSTHTCHLQGVLPCLLCYMWIECNGWYDSALYVIMCLLCASLVAYNRHVTLPSAYALGNVTRQIGAYQAST